MWSRANKLNDDKVLGLVNKVMLVPEMIRTTVIREYFSKCKMLYDIAFVQWLLEHREDEDTHFMSHLNLEKLKEMEKTMWLRLFKTKESFILNTGMSEFNGLPPDFYDKYQISIDDEKTKQSPMYPHLKTMKEQKSTKVIKSFRFLSITDPFPP